jgi:hypothetical protein
VAGALTPANVVLAITAYVAVRHSTTLAAAARWWVVTLALAVGVPYALLVRAMRTGRADDRQLVRRSQRPRLLGGAAVAVAGAVLVLQVAGAPRQVVALVLAMLCGLVVIGVTTLVWKASMHLSVAAGACAVLLLEQPTAGVAALAVLPVLAWARWRDGRHSWPQLAGGAVIGGAVAGVVYGLLR